MIHGPPPLQVLRLVPVDERRALSKVVAWLDSGTYDSLIAASQFVQTIEQRQGLKVACIEEIAFNKGFINEAQLVKCAEAYSKSSYGAYLMRVLEESKQIQPWSGV